MDDPVLVVPWTSSPDSSTLSTGSRFIDLREDPYAAEEVPEAERHPPLLQALRALNAPRSTVFTAKCDVWPISSADDLQALRLELDLAETDVVSGFGSYIDLLWRDRPIFASFHQHQHLVHRLERRVAALDQPFAQINCVIRPALLDLDGPQEGFALTLYVKAVGPDEAYALANWSSALQSTVAILRSKDFTPST